MLMSLMPAFSLTAWAGDVTSYGVWVGGVEVTSENASNIDGNNKASYNVDTKTLTLNGYSYNSIAHSFGNNAQ